MEITLEITDYCPNNCDYCSTNAEPIRKNIIGIKEIKKLLKKESDGIDRINISGGEPLSHPQFYQILLLCESYTNNVWVYSNAIKKLMYNTSIIKEVQVEANVCLVPGRAAYIPRNVNKVHLLQLVPQGKAKNMKPGKYHVSSNIKADNDCDHDCNTCITTSR